MSPHRTPPPAHIESSAIGLALARYAPAGTIALALIAAIVAGAAMIASVPGAGLASLLAAITVASVAWTRLAGRGERLGVSRGRAVDVAGEARSPRLEPESEAIRAAFDHDTIVLTLDRARCVTYANTAAAKLFAHDVDPATLRGRPIRDLLPALDDTDADGRSTIRTLLAGGTWRRDVPVAASAAPDAGTERRLDTTVRAIRRTAPSGRTRLGGFIVIASDVSDRRRSEIERHELADRLDRTARHVPGVIYEFLLRPDGTNCFPWASEGIRAIYDVSPADVRLDASAVFTVLHPDDVEHVGESIERSARTLEPWRCEYRVVLPGRGERWLLGHSAPQRLADGSTLWHGCITDITEQKRTEAALEARAAELTAASARNRALAIALDSTDDPVLLIDAAGAIVHGNPAYERLRDDLVGSAGAATPILDALRARTHRSRDAACALRDGHAWSGVVRLDDALGETRSLDVSLTPLVQADGTGGFVVVHRDVTDRERTLAHERLARLRARLLSDVVDRIAAEGAIETRVRGALEAMLETEILGRPTGARLRAPLGFHEESDAEETCIAIGTHEAGPKESCTTTIAVHGRAIGTLEIVGDAIDDDADATLAELARSIAPILDRARLEAELREARRRAETANEGKTGLLTTLSHELRTPLSAILGYTELLRAEGTLPTEQAHVLGVIENAGRHMLALLNEILDLSRIEAGRLTIDDAPTDVPRLVVEALEMLRSRAEAGRVDLAIEATGSIPRTIRSDAVRLRQVVVNLVGNAIKFSRGGRVTIRLGVETSDDGCDSLCVDVEDTGIGINEHDAARLFQPFVQADSRIERAFGGSGLGLSISRGIARVMNGDVVLARSAPGEGSTFRLRIPMRPWPDTDWIDSIDVDSNTISPVDASSGARSSVPASGSSSVTASIDPGVAEGPTDSDPTRTNSAPSPDDDVSNARILLVEDGPENRRLIAHHLRRAGAEVIEANDGAAGLDAFRAAADGGDPFDLVVTDMMMPTLDGYELARALRVEAPALPVIALTASAMADDRDRCLAAGCTDYLAKPITRDAIIGACAHRLRRPTQDSATRRHVA